MASRHGDPFAQAIGLYLALSFFLVLVLVASPIFLVGAAAIVGYKIFRAYQGAPATLAGRARERSLALHKEAQLLAYRQSIPSPEQFADDLMRSFTERRGDTLPIPGILKEFRRIARELYSAEQLAGPAIEPPAAGADAITEARYQDQVSERIAKLGNPATLDILRDRLLTAFCRFADILGPVALQTAEEASRGEQTPSQFEVPLLEATGNFGGIVEGLIAILFSEEVLSLKLFAALGDQFEANLRKVSGIPIGGDSSKLIRPSEFDGTAEEIVSGYLRHTPLEGLFRVALPFDIDDDVRMEHWHLVAGSGHGKTQTLQHIIMSDLRAADPPALVIIDSQGDMLRKIQQLGLFEHSDRLIIIDPEDDCAPALNMFDVPKARMQGYSRAVREQVEAGLVELFNYVFGALASELTAKQGTAFAYITRLMLSIPGASIHTFRELMETSNPASFAPYIQKLDTTAKAFFENQFFNRGAFGETRQQIARRLYTVLQVPAFERMFTSDTNRLDMFAALQSGKVVLINTSKALLKTEASALFGRYMIALTLNAAFERVAIPENQRTPAYLIIDEAAEYFDETLERLLAQARKFKLGVLFAHQHMDQLTPALRSAVATNTSIKMAGGLSDHDARLLAADMRTNPAFLSAMRKRDHSTEFACYVRNQFENAVRVRIPFGTLERAPKMSKDAHQAFLKRNRARYGVPGEPEPMVNLHHPDLPWKLEPEGQAGSEPSPTPDEPIVNLHRPDLPWKLEPTEEPPKKPPAGPKRRDPDDVDMKPSPY